MTYEVAIVELDAPRWGIDDDGEIYRPEVEGGGFEYVETLEEAKALVEDIRKNPYEDACVHFDGKKIINFEHSYLS